VQGLANLLPLVLIALVFWLLVVRPQRRRQQALTATQSSLEVGTEVMLNSGIYGRVASLEDATTIQVEVAPGTVLKVTRRAVARVVPDEPSPVDPHDQPDPDDIDPGSTEPR
jgi:preprotein translocase subunit YajC